MPNLSSPASDDSTILSTFNTDFTGFLSADLEEARREHDARGGYLFRMGDLFLVCCYEEALGWGWTPEELKLMPYRSLI